MTPLKSWIPRLALCGVIAGWLGGPSTVVSAEESFTLVGAKVLAEDGRLRDGLAVVVDKGRIVSVVADTQTGLPSRRELPAGSVISPGLIDLPSGLGVTGQNRTTMKPVDPMAQVVDAIDPFDPRLEVAVRSGITAAMVAPSFNNVVSGTTATVRTHRTGERLETLQSNGALVMTIGSSVLRGTAVPSSRNSAIQLLEECFEEAKKSTEPNQPVRQWMDGRRAGLLVCESDSDLRSTLPSLGMVGRFPTIALSFQNKSESATAELASGLSAAGSIVVVGPYNLSTATRQLRAPAIAHREGVQLAFAGGLPANNRVSARLSAALAVRHGLDPAAARRALTVHAAKVAGVGERLGRVASGFEADLVVFDGDPLRLDASVQEVYVKGVRVYRAKKASASPAASVSSGRGSL